MKKNNLPPYLKAFIDKGGSTINYESVSWTVALENITDNPWKKSIPFDALIFANNGCGNYM